MKIHFIGIGGIGVSGLAQYYLSKGHIVSGSDLVSSEITEFLEEKEIKITIGSHSENNLSRDANLVIYSPAVKPDNPEYKKAKELNIKLQSYPEALGNLTKQYFTIAVSGTHGKSTTTAMISLVLEKSGLDPTVIVGTKLKEFGDTNFRAGKSKILVIEADEHFASFLNYWPKIIVLTNMEKEHLDYYKNLNNIKKTYKQYLSHLGKDGILVANKEDKNINKIAKKGKHEVTFYSIKQKESKRLKRILKIPGKHNVYNALAVLTVARILGVTDKISFDVLSKYRGSWRRFDLKQRRAGGKKIIVISDYGHHPTEVLATLRATREKYPKKKIWCVFQPHQYQRTYYLFNNFVKIFRSLAIDNIIIADIYDVAGRETKKINAEISSEKLVKKIDKNNVRYFLLCDIEKHIKEHIKTGEVLIIMGAGDIYKLADKF
ncbi:MAG: UDP-N-acetylmuramate--L-alanine ligase [Candidatus Staskawiczbacteria bacterium]|nr:UDP-N-acetylmuramate--L-alanine ligase [Candidatus Staskawiczbacteria bacterium]